MSSESFLLAESQALIDSSPSRGSTAGSRPLMPSSSPSSARLASSTKSWKSTRTSDYVPSTYTSRTQSPVYTAGSIPEASTVAYSSLERIKKRQRDGKYEPRKLSIRISAEKSRSKESRTDGVVEIATRPCIVDSHGRQAAARRDPAPTSGLHVRDREEISSVIIDVLSSPPIISQDWIANSILHSVEARTQDLLKALSTADSPNIREHPVIVSDFRSQLDDSDYRRMKSHARTLHWAYSLLDGDRKQDVYAQDIEMADDQVKNDNELPLEILRSGGVHPHLKEVVLHSLDTRFL